MPLINFFNKNLGVGIDFGTYKSAVSITYPNGKNTKIVELPFVFGPRKFSTQSIPTRASISVTNNEFDIRLAVWHTGKQNTTYLRRFKLDIGKGWKENGTMIQKISSKIKNRAG